MSTYPAPEPNPTFKPQEVLPGQVFLTRYQVVRVLGRGAMGEVLEVLDKHSGLSYALKRVPPELVRDIAQMRSIQANFALVSQLAHPNIATTRHLELDTATGHAYLILELVRGTDLNYWILDQRDRRGQHDAPLPLATVLGIAEQIAAALDFAHSLPVSRDPSGKPSRFGVLHRDLKPANVMLDTARAFRSGIPYVKLVDFGLAAEIQASMFSLSVAPQRENTAGTLSYMSPEQWEGRTLTRGIDQWALAVVIYEMAAGRKPFVASSAQALFVQVKNANPEPPAVLSPLQWAALRKAFHPDRKQRYRSCVEFVRALAGADKATEGSIVSAEMPMPDEFDPPRTYPATAPETPLPAPVQAAVPVAPPATAPVQAQTPVPTPSPAAAQAQAPVPVPLAPLRMQAKDFGLPVPKLPDKLPTRGLSPAHAQDRSKTPGATPLLALGACVLVLAVLGGVAWIILGKTGNKNATGPIAKTDDPLNAGKSGDPYENGGGGAADAELPADLKPLTVVWEDNPAFELWYTGAAFKNEGARRSALVPPGGWLEITAPGAMAQVYHELLWQGQPEVHLRQTGELLEMAEAADGPWVPLSLNARLNTAEALKAFTSRKDPPACVFVPDLVYKGTLEALKKLGPKTIVYGDAYDVKDLAQVPALRRLSLMQSKLATSEGLAEFKQLTALDLSLCDELKEIDALRGLDKLDTVLLYSCVKIKDLTPLDKLKNLRELFLPPTATDGDLARMREAGAFDKLAAFGCPGAKGVTSAHALAGAPSLRALDLSGCSDTFDFESLEGFRGLRTLILPPCTKEALDGLRRKGTLSTLASLNLQSSPQLKGMTALNALRGLNRLTQLTLDGCNALDNLEPLLELPGLSELSLKGCASAAGVEVLAALKGLRRLALPPALTDANLKQLRDAGALDDLVHLELEGCDWVTNLKPLEGLTALRKLSVHACLNLNREVLLALSQAQPDLVIDGLADAPLAPAKPALKDPPAADPAAKLPGDPVPQDANPLKTASGLVYYEFKKGDGTEAAAGDEVTVEYAIYLEKDGKKIDSSKDRNEPMKFKLSGVLIPGMEEGLKGMQAGGTRKLVVPPNLAYGDAGSGAIPAGAVLVIDVTLREVSKATEEAEPDKPDLHKIGPDAGETQDLAAPISAVLQQLPVPVGTFLHKGAPVVQVSGFDSTAMKARVETAKAALEKARTEFADADKIHKRNLALQKQGLVSSQEVVASGMKQMGALWRQETAQNDLANEQKMLAQGGPLVMPFDGVVVKYHAEIGQTIQAGQPFLTVRKATEADKQKVEEAKSVLDKLGD